MRRLRPGIMTFFESSYFSLAAELLRIPNDPNQILEAIKWKYKDATCQRE